MKSKKHYLNNEVEIGGRILECHMEGKVKVIDNFELTEVSLMNDEDRKKSMIEVEMNILETTSRFVGCTLKSVKITNDRITKNNTFYTMLNFEFVDKDGDYKKLVIPTYGLISKRI